MAYPAWPELTSINRFREDLISGLTQGASSGLINLQNIQPGMPVWTAEYRGVMIFLKQEFQGMGRVGSLDNESAVLSVLNSLREIIPNFTMGLLTLMISDQAIPGLRNLNCELPFCPGKEVLITEFIPGPLIRDYLETNPPFEKILSLYIQTLKALEIARSRTGLVHGDLLTSNIILKRLPGYYQINYDGLIVEDDQFPIIYDFDRSYLNSFIGPVPDYRRDIYTALFSMFRSYPSEFRKLLEWYGVDYRARAREEYSGRPIFRRTSSDGPQSNKEWIETMTPRLIPHSVSDLIRFSYYNFGYLPKRAHLEEYPILKPENIPGFEPSLDPFRNLGQIIRETRDRFENRSRIGNRTQRKGF